MTIRMFRATLLATSCLVPGGLHADGDSRDVEVDLMADVITRRAPNRPTYESFAKEEMEPEDA